MSAPEEAAPAGASSRRARSVLAKLDARERGARRNESELEWFLRRMNGQVPEEGRSSPEVREAATTIDGWLRAMAPHLRGALALRFSRRSWALTLRKEFGDLTGLVVRLECARHPSAGQKSPEEVETAAVAQLEEEIAACGRRRAAVAACVRSSSWVTRREAILRRRYRRAALYVKRALEQYAFVRGAQPCVLPRAVDWDRDDA